MHVKSSMNEGRLVALIAKSGEPVEKSLWKSPAVMDPLKGILRSLHTKGWHHHDIHRHNVMQDEGSIYLVDFGKAQRSEACHNGAECPELAFVSALKSQDDSEYPVLPSMPPPAYPQHPERSLASGAEFGRLSPELQGIDKPITSPPSFSSPPLFSLDRA